MNVFSEERYEDGNLIWSADVDATVAEAAIAQRDQIRDALNANALVRGATPFQVERHVGGEDTTVEWTNNRFLIFVEYLGGFMNQHFLVIESLNNTPLTVENVDAIKEIIHHPVPPPAVAGGKRRRRKTRKTRNQKNTRRH